MKICVLRPASGCEIRSDATNATNICNLYSKELPGAAQGIMEQARTPAASVQGDSAQMQRAAAAEPGAAAPAASGIASHPWDSSEESQHAPSPSPTASKENETGNTACCNMNRAAPGSTAAAAEEAASDMYGCSGVHSLVGEAMDINATVPLHAGCSAPGIKDSPLSPTQFLLKEIR